MTYNPKSANPFVPGATSWTSNNLILQDPLLRAKAGVAVLDKEVSEVFQYTAQHGGAATGAPFYVKNYGMPGAGTYTEAEQIQLSAYEGNVYANADGSAPTPAPVPTQSGGMPRKYYDPEARW